MGGVLGQTVKQEHKSIVKFVQVFQHTIPRDMLLVVSFFLLNLFFFVL